ncbi:MAG: YncE family protein [Actinomycetota bacterium]|nr:YncE family protein [Actinomycetota bacterium]
MVNRTAAGAVAGAVLACLLGVAGCGNSYRPVVSAINPVGPASQPQKYAVAVSSPTPPGSPCPAAGQATSNGLVTIVDFSGDTVLITASLGVNPYFFGINSAGTTGYTLNCDRTLNTFDISNQLITSQVLQTTLLPGSNPVTLFASSSATYLADPGLSVVDQLAGSPPALKQELPVAANPVWVVGQNSSARLYAISQGSGSGVGQVAAIETSGNTISTTLPVGRTPVYGVMTSDQRRAFILNQGDNTVSVINAVSNGLDTAVPSFAVGTRPVWADLVSTKNELVVANAGTGTSAGSLTVVNIPLCSASALPTNPNCDTANPVDATGFGTVLATVPVGINPVMVATLSDGTRAYVANAGVRGLPCAANGVAVAGVSTTCTISVVNLTSNTVTATIPISGHPTYIAATNSTPTGKVYVVCNDSQVMTVIETDTDTVDTTIPLQGYGVSVRVTAQ